MAGSSSERAIRDTVADFARARLPDVRIIHELVVEGCRADLAAVERDRVTLFEFKSEKDTLDRLERQMRSFRKAGHAVVLVAHRKWWKTHKDGRGFEWLSFDGDKHTAHAWCFPEPRYPNASPWAAGTWRLPKPSRAQPAARHLLGLLWKAELTFEAKRHGLHVTQRMTMGEIISEMAFAMTGEQIAEAACRQLRARSFPEADAAIPVEPLGRPSIMAEGLS